MAIHGISIGNYFGQRLNPKKTTKTKGEISAPLNLEAIKKFFGGDLLTMLGQGDKKNTPAMNPKKAEEPNSPEMEAEIKELFGENYDNSDIF